MTKHTPTNTNPTPEQILDAPMREGNDAEAATVRDYLIELLKVTWQDQPKKPFGNSGWLGDLHVALGQAGLIEYEVDEDGYLDDADWRATDKLIAAAIESLRRE